MSGKRGSSGGCDEKQGLLDALDEFFEETDGCRVWRETFIFCFRKMVALGARSQDPVLSSNWVTNARLVIRRAWRFLSSLVRRLMARSRMWMFSGFSMKASAPNCTAFRY